MTFKRQEIRLHFDKTSSGSLITINKNIGGTYQLQPFYICSLTDTVCVARHFKYAKLMHVFVRHVQHLISIKTFSNGFLGEETSSNCNVYPHDNLTKIFPLFAVESTRIFEGDILLDQTTQDLLRNLARRKIRSAISTPNRKWPSDKIPDNFGAVSKWLSLFIVILLSAFSEYEVLLLTFRFVCEGSC